MLTVNEARRKILDAQPVGVVTEAPLGGGFGLVLAADISSRVSLPVFDSSAMDGFAVRSADTTSASADAVVTLVEIEEIWAGKTPEKAVFPGCAARIMTGAQMPSGADAVVIREDVECHNGEVALKKPARLGDNVRKAGEEVLTGDKILDAGTVLNAAAIAVLAGCGVTPVPVYPRPRVAVIPTGSELENPGEALSGSKIYESNSFALAAALKEFGIDARIFPIVPDDEAKLGRAVAAAVAESTHVIVTGGVSVGDYDHNKAVFADCGITEVLWKVAQKPGKPLYVGKIGSTIVFGLPGNPASALTCFYEYVRPALAKFMGCRDVSEPAGTSARLGADFLKKAGLTHFIRGRAETRDGAVTVMPLPLQQSHMMTSFVKADCLIVLPAEADRLPAGSEVRIHWLPGKGVLCA